MAEPIAVIEYRGQKVQVNTSGYFSVDMGSEGSEHAATFQKVTEFIDKQLTLRARTTKLSLKVIGLCDSTVCNGVLTGVHRTTNKLVFENKADLGYAMADTTENRAMLQRFIAAETEKKAATVAVYARLIRTGGGHGRIEADHYEDVLKVVEASYQISAGLVPEQEKAGG